MHAQSVTRNAIRVFKIGLLTLPLIAAAWFFGTVCRRMETGHLLLAFDVRPALLLLRDLVLAWATLALMSTVVALLFRPLWMAAVAFVLAGLALLLGAGVTATHALIALWFLLAGLGYAAIMQHDVSQRIEFSIIPVAAGQFGFLVVLLVLAIGAFYMGAASHVRTAGFLLPNSYAEDLAERLASRVAAVFPALIQQEVHDSVRGYARQLLTEELDRLMVPVRPYLPIAAAIALFLPLLAVACVLPWVILPVLWFLLLLLSMVGLTRIVTETREVKRLVLS